MLGEAFQESPFFPLSSWQEICGLLTWMVFVEETIQCIFGIMMQSEKGKLK